MILTLLLTLALAQDIETLLRQLSDEDPKVRDAASATLRKARPESADLDDRIQALTRSRDNEVAIRAREILNYRRLARRVEDLDGLLRQLESKRASDRKGAVRILAGQDRDAVPLLGRMVGDPDSYVRAAAVEGLARIGAPECVAPLHRALEPRPNPLERAPRVVRARSTGPVNPPPEPPRRTAFAALAKMKDERARNLTRQLLQRVVDEPDFSTWGSSDHVPASRDVRLVYTAIEAAAGPFRSKQTLDQLKAVFPRVDWTMKAAVVRAVARWEEGAQALRPAIVAALDKNGVWAREAVEALIGFGWPELNRGMQRLAIDPEHTTTACRFLGAVRDVGAVPMLLRIVKYGAIDVEESPDPVASMAAAWALGEMASEDAVESLLLIWKLKTRSHSADGRHSALPSILKALGRIGDNRSLPVMRGALDHSEEEIRFAAAEAVGHVGDRTDVVRLMGHLDDVIGFPLYDDHPGSYIRRPRGRAIRTRTGRWSTFETVVPIVRPMATVREAVVQALARITGDSFQGTSAEQAAAWKKWWAQHKDEYR